MIVEDVFIDHSLDTHRMDILEIIDYVNVSNVSVLPNVKLCNLSFIVL